MGTGKNIKQTGGDKTPLKLFQPMGIIVSLSFFSPIIVAFSVTSLSFIFQNWKGVIYLGFLIGFCLFRSYVYSSSGSEPTIDDDTVCTSIQYSKYGNPTFSSFVFAFTIVYLSLPMFSNGAANLWTFVSLLAYFMTDLFIKQYKKCVVKMSELFLNVLFYVKK